MSKKRVSCLCLCSVFKQIWDFIQNMTNWNLSHLSYRKQMIKKAGHYYSRHIALYECSILHCRNKMYSEHNSQTITEKLQITHLIECEILKLKNFR